MAVFRATQNVCELNFDDKYFYNLPLHEEVADKIDHASEKLRKLKPTDRNGVDDAYNTALDCIDEILGDGEAEKIMTLFEHPGIIEVIKVVMYIASEWKDAYSAVVDEMKATAELPNRETRRARR